MTISNQAFYDSIADAQAYVANEIDLVKLYHKASSLKSQQYDGLLQSFYLRYKAYFTQQLLLSLNGRDFNDPSSKLSRQVLGPVESTFSAAGTAKLKFTLETEGLARLCTDETNPLIRDVITFSIIPSFFNFFIVGDAEHEFFNFLPNIPEHLFNTYVRVLFVTPRFVKFIHESFYPLFQSRLNSTSRTSHIPLIKDKTPFLNAWREKVPLLCPTYISRVLKASTNSSETFRQCFINPFLDQPQRWHVWDAWDEGSKEEKDELRRIFADESTISQLVTIIKDCPDLYSPGIPKELERVAPDGWHTYILSTLDRPVLEFVAKPVKQTRPFALPKSYEVFAFHRVGEEIPKSLAEEAAAGPPATQNPQADIPMFLREVLKKSPYLPVGRVVSEDDDLIEVLRSYLVGQASLQDQPKQAVLFARFQSCLDTRRITLGKAITDLNGFSRTMKYAHDEQSEVLQKSAGLGRQLAAAEYVLGLASGPVGNVLRVRSFKIEEIRPPPPEESIYDPERFTLALLDRFKVLGITQELDRHVYFHLFSRGIDLRTYRRINPTLRALDDRFNALAAAGLEATKQRALNDPHSSRAYREAAAHFEVFTEVGQRFISIFEENVDGLTMSDHVTAIFRDVIQVYKVNFSGLAELGAEDEVPLYELLVRHFPPKTFVSGLWLMCDFTYRSGTAAEPITNVASMMQLFGLAQLILGPVKPGPGWWRSRGMMRNRRIAVSVPAAKGKITGIHAEVIALLAGRPEWATEINIGKTAPLTIRFEVVPDSCSAGFIVDAIIAPAVKSDAKVSVWFDDGGKPSWLQSQVSAKRRGIVISEKPKAQFAQFPQAQEWLFITLVDGNPAVIRRMYSRETLFAAKDAEEIVWGIQKQLGELLTKELYELV